MCALNVKQTAKTHNHSGTAIVQGVGVSLHHRLGYKARFSGAGNTAEARFKHLAKVKETGYTTHAHNEIFMLQLSAPCSELQAAVLMRDAYDDYAMHCNDAKLRNGYTENHLNAILAFIASHSTSAISDAENQNIAQDLNIADDGIFG